MDDLALIVDLHRDAARLGPGGEDETRRAVALSGLEGAKGLRIADIGCGTGAAAFILARALDAHVTAVDIFPEFLAELEAAAARERLDARVRAVEARMEALPFAEGEFDAIWSEGAIYNMDFAAGVEAWRRFLKPGGVLAVSELTWLTASRPAALDAHWNAAYPEVGPASAKIAVLERLGFAPIGFFTLPRRCWMENYYDPMRRRFPAFLERNGGSDAARALVAAEEAEIALYERHAAFVSYGYYIARKVAG